MHPDASALRLQLDADTQQILASYQPQAELAAPTRARLQQALAAQQLAEAKLDEAAIDAFLSQCAQGEVEAMPIGRCEDAKFEFKLSADQLRVWLRLEPACGGQPVTLAQLLLALAERGIVHGVNEAALTEALARGRCEDWLIAEGREPEPGSPTRFEKLLRQSGPAGGDERSPVDYREYGALIVVDPGTPLMRRFAARPGRAGIDVHGQAIAPREQPDLPFEAVSGAAPAPHDPDLLIASIAGLPSAGPRGVAVNPKVEVQDVDLQSGNIRFDGSVHVKGDVRAGMSMRVSGDVFVDGTVEAAELIAGGHLIVKGGIIGRAEHNGAKATAQVRCQGDVQARFIEHADIEAGGQVRAEAGIRDSQVLAGDAVLVGANGSLVGGRTAAHRLIKTPVLGDAWGDPTEVQVGVNPFIDAKLAALRADRQQREAERAKLQQLQAYLAQQPAGGPAELRDKAERTLLACEQAIAGIELEAAALIAQLELSDKACIEVQRSLHGGVRLMVGASVLQVVEDRGGAQVRRVDGQIELR
jgi:uncharacterized protein (DUF342 family)